MSDKEKLKLFIFKFAVQIFIWSLLLLFVIIMTEIGIFLLRNPMDLILVQHQEAVIDCINNNVNVTINGTCLV